MGTPKAYCELGALTGTVKALRDAGRLIVVNFPYEGKTRKVDRAEPSLVSADTTYLTADSTLLISETGGSHLLPEVRRIVGPENEFDARHLDSAYRSGCDFFNTSDRRDIVAKRDRLEPLLNLKILHHQDYEDLILELIDAHPSPEGGDAS